MIIVSIDKGEATPLILLDLSPVFDTIDHTTLTSILSHWYRISGQAHIWFSFNLKNRLQSVRIKDNLPDKVRLSYEAPQGFILRPLLFILYRPSTPLSAMISSFDSELHIYADYTQNVLRNFKRYGISVENLQHCSMGVSVWVQAEA